jgi:hypothetical protein
MTPDRERELVRLAGSSTLVDSLRLFAAGGRLVRELLEALDQERRYWIDQVRRRDADKGALEGRLAVAIDAAAREGWRQAHADAGGESRTHLDLERARRVAHAAEPNVVTGEIAMRRVRSAPLVAPTYPAHPDQEA